MEHRADAQNHAVGSVRCVLPWVVFVLCGGGARWLGADKANGVDVERQVGQTETRDPARVVRAFRKVHLLDTRSEVKPGTAPQHQSVRRLWEVVVWVVRVE